MPRPFSTWSFIRAVLEQGRAIQMDNANGMYPNYELLSAHIDEAARKRDDALLEGIKAIGHTPEQWNPIENAPRDGAHILVADLSENSTGFGIYGGKRVPWQAVAHWWANPGEEGFYLSSGDPGSALKPTHWKAL
jgi:hypothetical protein